MSEHEQNNETIAWKAGGDWRNFRDDPRVTAYALGELEALDEESVAAIAAQIARDPELRQYVEDLRATGESLSAELSVVESSSAVGAIGSPSATGATGSPDAKGGRLASAEEYMAAAFKNEAPTQTVSAPEDKPHAAAGSGRRAPAASRIAPSPFRRHFALGAAAAMLVVSVLVGLMVANYGAQSPATPVAAEVPTASSGPFENIGRSVPQVAEIPYPETNDLTLDAALELQIGQYKTSPDAQPATSSSSVASVDAVQDTFQYRGTGGASTSSGGTSSGAGFFGEGPAPAPQPGPVLQRRNQRISKLLEEVDRVTDERFALREEDTKLSWAPEKYNPTRDLDPYYLDSQEVDPKFEAAHSFELVINGSPSTIDGTNRAIDGTIDSFQPGRAAVGLSQVAGEWVDGVPRGTKDEISRGMTRWPGNMPPARVADAYQALDAGLTYSESTRRAGPPLNDSTVTADAKPIAEVAETDLPQAGQKACELTTITTKQPEESGLKLTEQQRLQKDIAELKARLGQLEKKSPGADAPIGAVNAVVGDKYGPNALGGLKQAYFESLAMEKSAVGLSQVSGEWIDGTPGDTSGNGVTIDGQHNDAQLLPMEFAARYEVMNNLFDQGRVALGQEAFKTQVITEGINYFIKGHNAKLKFNYSVVAEEDDVNNTNLAILHGLVSKEEAWRLTRSGGRYQEIVANELLDYQINPWWPRTAVPVTELCIPNQHWADQFRPYHGITPHHDFTISGWNVATGYRLNNSIWADRDPTRGHWIRGEWSGKRSPAPEAPGGMVVWHFNAADPARGQANDMWRLTRIGGRFSDLMSSIDNYRIGGAVKDGGLALVGVDGEFDHGRMGYVAPHPDEGRQTESYAVVNENPFEKARTISTFSIDVDTASYSNVRRFLNDGSLPPPGAVRYEELINYFRYAYEPPPSDAKEPFATHVEVATCPWNAAHRLVRIALKGREIDPNSRPSSNLVFLVDVSGSMSDANKLGLVQQGLRLLVDNLNARDHVAIVTYAGAAGVALKSTSCDQKIGILNAINNLNAGGSTNGAQGIITAYELAQKGFIKGGTNRVILCTDGDFNVGTTSNDQLVKLIEKQAKSGVFLSVLGFGMGNYKDDKLEAIADKGNGHYAYIDSFQEAKKIFGSELAGTLVTIAKDVKVQVEFNPATAHSYRLIGYENRLMRKEDFADDTKDAGEIGAGHTVTALYEVIPAGAEEAVQPTRVPLDVLLLNAKPEDVAKLAFIWKQTGGPKADLRDADRPNAYFLPTADGEYEFEVSAIADESVIKTTVKRTVKVAELAAPNAPAERASRYLEEAKVKEDAKTSGELLTVWLRYKQPEEDQSTELSVPVRDGGKKLEQSSQDFRFASSVAAFGMLLRGSVYAKGLNWDFVLELAGESKSADAEAQAQRAEFIDLAKKAKALSGK